MKPEIIRHGVILSKTDFIFENEGVLNPAAICIGDKVHLFYRAVSRNNFSTIGYCRLNGPLEVEYRSDTPLLYPQSARESNGLEDPRIVEIEGTFYLTYTAYDGLNALGALATSTDLIHFEKQGCLVPEIAYDDFIRLAGCKAPLNQHYMRYNSRNRSSTGNRSALYLWDKNLIFFPRRIGGLLYFLHRIKPDIQIAAVQEISELTPDFWEHYLLHFADHIALAPRYPHELSYIGGGCPPIETAAGWVLIYHGVHDTTQGYVYTACAALLSLDNPGKELARLPEPLFQPQLAWEYEGVIGNVCFPTGTALFGDRLYLLWRGRRAYCLCVCEPLRTFIGAIGLR